MKSKNEKIREITKELDLSVRKLKSLINEPKEYNYNYIIDFKGVVLDIYLNFNDEDNEVEILKILIQETEVGELMDSFLKELEEVLLEKILDNKHLF